MVEEEEEEKEEEETHFLYDLLNPIVCHGITDVIQVVSLEQTQPTIAVEEKGKGNNPVLNTTAPLTMSFNSKLLECQRNIPSIFTTPALFVIQNTFVSIILVT